MITVDDLAAAMREAYGLHVGEPVKPWAQADKDKQEAWRVCVRAALEAMRTPSDSAGRAVNVLTGKPLNDPQGAVLAHFVLRETIDAILEEG
ncbi:hypothetical protein [Caulobacter phage KcrB]|nr:hypothetical protein RW_GP046 [Caulobacter phage RW]WCA46350.1 hypothetical protein [Caulobacter phage KcrB]WCD56285.1 hypothetical protein [Caulobacter phage RLK]WNV48077.1 hypothetical protein GB2A_gp045 [Caulobacter phage GB2A]